MGWRELLVACVSVGLSSACATLVRPVGDWPEPPNLNISKNALKGVSVEVICARQGRNDPNWQPDNPIVCTGLKKILESIGATVTSGQLAGDHEEVLPGSDDGKVKTKDKAEVAPSGPPKFSVL